MKNGILLSLLLKYNIVAAKLNRLGRMVLLITALLAWNLPIRAQTADLSGQASAWITVQDDDTNVGLQYIPELSMVQYFSEFYEMSAEAAVNAQWSSRDKGQDQSEWSLDPYRLWLRFASAQFELRTGLQKISFGSAALLRPLMWFDTVDPRDPLQLTDGVYGLLGRYYFLNNANIWLWALYGNDNLTGWELLPTDKWRIEYGGRIQLPVLSGEMGLSFDRRWINSEGNAFNGIGPLQETFPEERIGLDGKWDIGVGVWFEGTLTHLDFDAVELRYHRLLTIGMDYTFDVGNGLHLLGEYFERVTAKDAFGSGNRQAVTALSVDYPLSLIDTVMAISYYNSVEEGWSHFITWQRTYDQWQVNVSAFSNPDRPLLDQDKATNNNFAGNGMQLMLVFNH